MTYNERLWLIIASWADDSKARTIPDPHIHYVMKETGQSYWEAAGQLSCDANQLMELALILGIDFETREVA